MSIWTDIAGGVASLIPGVGPAIGAGIAGIGGALSNTAGARTSTSGPTISPGYQSLADLLKARAMGRLTNPTDLSGYTAGGIENINNAYNNVGTSLNANLTARGLASSPVAAAALTKLGTARAGDIANFQNTIPLLQRQLQDQDMANAQGLVNNFGIGRTATGAGSALGGGFTSAAEMLAYLKGKQGIGGGFQYPSVTPGGGIE